MAYHLGDGLEMMRSIPDDSVDGIFTDPPWGYKRVLIEGQENWQELLQEMTAISARILKPEGVCLIWMGMRSMADAIKAIQALKYRWTIFVSYMPPRYIAGFESLMDPLLVYQRHDCESFPKSYNGRKLRQIYFKASVGKKDTIHPCARPFTTVKTILNDWFGSDSYVIDPFAGSDTTGRACEELRIRWDTSEIDPAMYKTGEYRHSQQLLFLTDDER